VHAPDKTLLVVDHNVPTTDRSKPNPDPESAAQIAYLAENAKLFGLEYYNEFDIRQGICHVIGPEQGFTLPGVTLVCGDSHTATHGAFGALAYGIGTSEVEHVLATQTLIQSKSKNMRAVVDGKLPRTSPPRTSSSPSSARSAPPAAPAIAGICRRGDPRAVDGRPHDRLQHVGRGRRQGRLHRAGREGLRYAQGPPKAPKGKAWDDARALLGHAADRRRRAFRPRDQARRRKLPPIVTWGTSPSRCLDHRPRAGAVEIADEHKRRAAERSLEYMGLKGGEKITDIASTRVHRLLHQLAHRGSARGARIADGKTVSASVNAMIVPGSAW
jgi:3-isopropylmalate/(R)-2-methylmalate dehydratase large subunit